MSPRTVGRLFLFFGAGGVIVTVAVAFIAVLAVDRIAGAADQTLDIAEATISDVDTALEAAASTTRGARESLIGLSEAIGDSTATLEGSQGALDGMARLIETDLADSIDAVVTVLPALSRVGDALDETLAALDRAGIAQIEADSAGDAVRNMQSSLGPVPGQLRSQGQILGELNADVGGIIGRSAETRQDLALVEAGLLDAEKSLADFSFTATRLEDLIADTRDALALGRILGFVVVGLLAFIFIGLQAVPVYVGLRLRRPDLPETVAALLRERKGTEDTELEAGAP
jgi:hypothetical protein